ncbi:MAG: hypothetical protein ABIO46_00370 [Chitinophagales bacterium]
MKKLFLPLLSMFTYIHFVSAQESSPAAVAPVEKIRIDVQESKEKMSLGVNNCLKVYIPEATKEDVDRDLLKYMKNYNSKGDSKKSEYFYDNAEIKAFGNNLVDVYAQTEQKAGGVELKVFFDLGGAFLNSSNDPDKYKAAEEVIGKFARDESVATVGIQIAAAQKQLDVRIKEYDNLVRQDSVLSKKIRDSQAIIKQAETDQKTVRVSQDTKKKEMEIQQQQMEGLKSKQAGIE